MLGVLLTILKIIGWILLAILALIVLITLIVLLVPVRYQVEAHGESDLNKLSVQGRATWLLHLLSVRFAYEERSADTQVRFAWKKLGDDKTDDAKSEDQHVNTDDSGGSLATSQRTALNREAREVHAHAAESQPGGDDHSSVQDDDSSARAEEQTADAGETDSVIEMRYEGTYVPEGGDRSSDQSIKERKSRRKLTKEEKQVLKEKKKAEKAEKKEQKQKEKQDKKEAKRRAGEEKKANKKKRHLPDIDRIREIVHSIGDRREDIMSFCENRSHRKALAHLWKRVKKTGKKLIPKDWHLGGTLGSDDPYLTGRLAALAAVLYPRTGEHMPLEFDFEEPVLDLNGNVKGRLRLGTLVAMVFPLLIDRHFWRTIKDAKRLKSRIDKTSELIKGGKAA